MGRSTHSETIVTESAPSTDERPARRFWHRFGGPWLHAAGLVAVLIAIGLSVWGARLRNALVPKKWGEVVPGKLYRSGELSPALMERTLRDHNIQVVVDLRQYTPHGRLFKIEREICDKLGIEHDVFPMRGSGIGNLVNYADALETIHTAVETGKPVLVHCAAGTHRTGGVIATYRMLVQGRPADEVLREMTDYGWKPHKHYRLAQFLNHYMKRLAEMLVERDVIDRVPDPIPVIRL
jgi:protein-tyrosine phosphatase